MTTRILLADSQQLFRNGLRALLDQEVDFAVVGEADDGKELLDLFGALAPDVVCMDVDLLRMDEVQAARQMRESRSDVRLIALSDRVDWPAVRDAVGAGADSYVCKSARVADLLRAIRGEASGRQ